MCAFSFLLFLSTFYFVLSFYLFCANCLWLLTILYPGNLQKGEKTEDYAFQISKPKGCVSVLPCSFSYGSSIYPPPSSLNQTQSRRTCAQALAPTSHSSSPESTLSLCFRMNPQEVEFAFLKSVSTEQFSYYLWFFLGLPSWRLRSSPDPIVLVLCMD